MQKNFSCDANQKWACSGCTYLNWPKTIRCVQCETPRENVDNVINCLEPSATIGAGSGDYSGSTSSGRSRNRSVSGSSSNDEIRGSSREFESQFASVYISDLYNNKAAGCGDSEKSAIANKQYSTTSSSSPTISSLYITEPSASSLSRIESITTKSTMMIDEEEYEVDEFDEGGNISALNKTLNTTNLLKNEKSTGVPLISDYDKPLLKKQNNNVKANEAASNLILNNDVSPAAALSSVSTSSDLKYKNISQNFNNLIGKESVSTLRGQEEPSLIGGGRTEFSPGLATSSLPKISNANKHLSPPEAARSSLFNEGSRMGSESGSSSKISASNTAANCNSNTDKWTCGVCTYDNWPRSMKCVMCLTPRITSEPVDASLARPRTPKSERSAGINQNSDPSLPGGDGLSQVQIGSNVGTGNNRISTSGGSPLLSNNRRTLEIDTRWFEACHGVVDGNIVPVERYLAAGGDPARQLTQFEVSLLNRPSAFDIGFTLIHLALRFHQEHVLAILLSQVDNQPTVVKRVPSYAAPDLAMDIRRLAMSSLRQRKGNFHCYYTSEVVTSILPSEILDLRPEVQETLFNEILDRDVQKELETGQIINWSVELMGPLNSRLYALWNRSAGDCLLDSVLQATWGIFDRDNGLRRALADSLHECATMFYQRWKENELLHAHLLQFSLNDSQCATDWAKLLSLASKPGSSLEQLHIFALAHILRRPIIVYGVKYVKSFRGETLGYARYEGVYLPLLWDSTFCWKWPIALGYTRGHFSALVGLEPDCVPVPGASAPQLEDKHINQSIFLPLNSLDGNILPIHFLTKSEIGKEEMILSQWLDVRFIDSGVMVACQRIQKQPPLVGQMVDEWLNHYRRLSEITSAPYMHPPPATCYSSDDSDD